MNGSKEFKRYVSLNRKVLKARYWDDLLIFKLRRCKKSRKKSVKYRLLSREFEMKDY